MIDAKPDCVAIVAGVGPGLGAALVHKFAGENCSVAMFARSSEFIGKLAARIGRNAVAIPTDVANPKQVAAAFAKVRQQLGPVEILVTPRMHGIHHSIVQRETNSNWGTMFCWWDKLHRTLRRDVPQDAITVGVAAYREENELTLGKLLALPFRAQREWRLPNGEIPERDLQPAEELSE